MPNNKGFWEYMLKRLSTEYGDYGLESNGDMVSYYPSAATYFKVTLVATPTDNALVCQYTATYRGSDYYLFMAAHSVYEKDGLIEALSVGGVGKVSVDTTTRGEAELIATDNIYRRDVDEGLTEDGLDLLDETFTSNIKLFYDKTTPAQIAKLVCDLYKQFD